MNLIKRRTNFLSKDIVKEKNEKGLRQKKLRKEKRDTEKYVKRSYRYVTEKI